MSMWTKQRTNVVNKCLRGWSIRIHSRHATWFVWGELSFAYYKKITKIKKKYHNIWNKYSTILHDSIFSCYNKFIGNMDAHMTFLIQNCS